METHDVVMGIFDGADKQHRAEWKDCRQRIQRRDLRYHLYVSVTPECVIDGSAASARQGKTQQRRHGARTQREHDNESEMNKSTREQNGKASYLLSIKFQENRKQLCTH